MKLFRNSTGSLDEPLALSDDQLLDVIDRGRLEDWDTVVAALIRDPHGEFAQKVERTAWQSEVTGAGNAFIVLIRLLRGEPSRPLLRHTVSFEDGY